MHVYLEVSSDWFYCYESQVHGKVTILTISSYYDHLEMICLIAGYFNVVQNLNKINKNQLE